MKHTWKRIVATAVLVLFCAALILMLAPPVSGEAADEVAKYEELLVQYNDLLEDYDRLLADYKRLDVELHDVVDTYTELIEQAASEPEETEWNDVGVCTITHYCPCVKCTGKNPGDSGYGITRTGVTATAGRTVAVDSKVIPLGSEVLINGVVYIAEDTGVKGNVVDIFIPDHAQCLAMGAYKTTVKWRPANT